MEIICTDTARVFHRATVARSPRLPTARYDDHLGVAQSALQKTGEEILGGERTAFRGSLPWCVDPGAQVSDFATFRDLEITLNLHFELPLLNAAFS